MKIVQNTMFFNRSKILPGHTRWLYDAARLTEDGRKSVDDLINRWHVDVRPGGDCSIGVCKPFGVHFAVEKPRIAEAVLRSDQPWEDLLNYASTVFDAQTGKFKLWYSIERADGVQLIRKDGTVLQEKWLMGYAESEDGLHWEKPLLDHVFCDGKPTNILNAMIDSGTVFIDPRPKDGMRFKACSLGVDWSETVPEGEHVWLYLLGSSDGLEWKLLDTPKRYGFFDTQNVAAYDEQLQKYVFYFREANCGRAIARAECETLDEIPAPVSLMHPSCQDPLDTDYYTNGFTAHPFYPEMRLFFSTMFHHSADTMDVRLAVSSDGRVFEWVSQEAVIDCLDSAGKQYPAMYAYPSLLPVGGEVGLLLCRCEESHDGGTSGWYGTAAENFYSMAFWDKDRLVGLRAEETGEFFVDLAATEGVLEINYRTLGPKGYVKAEIQQDNRVAEGYSLEDCSFLNGDGRWVVCRWQNRDRLEGFADGMRTVLRLHLENAVMYGIRVLAENGDPAKETVWNNVL